MLAREEISPVMSQSIQAEAETFAKSYATLFSSPACSSSEDVAHIANEVGKRYRPGITFFTNGQITRFEVSPTVGFISPF